MRAASHTGSIAVPASLSATDSRDLGLSCGSPPETSHNPRESFILWAMPEHTARLSTALADRCRIERQLGDVGASPAPNAAGPVGVPAILRHRSKRR